MSKTKAHKPNQLRIIGGTWRGRKLHFPDSDGLRPTPDRVRETLFNWLQPLMHGARCLDLFAGSGALGLEALSRGAAEVVMVDRDPQVIATLRQHVALLQAQGAQLLCADSMAYLQHPSMQRPFDIVFLDPPFHQDLLAACCRHLEEQQWLSDTARIYLESENAQPLTAVPPNWRITHSKRAGQVSYQLAAREAL